MKNLQKKGFTPGQMLPIAITIVIAAIAISLGADVLDEVRQTQCTVNASNNHCIAGTITAASNATTYGLGAMSTFGEWLPTIALIVVIAVILGILIVYLANRFRG